MGSGTVLLVLWALVFRVDSARHEEANLDKPAKEREIVSTPDSGIRPPGSAPPMPAQRDWKPELEKAPAIQGKGNPSVVQSALDPMTLYAKSRSAVVTI